MDKVDNVCKFCSKIFTNKVNLLQHQRTVKSCLKLQGKDKETDIECPNCKKTFSIKYYKQHKLKCNLIEKDQVKFLEDTIQKLELEIKRKRKK